MAKNKNNQSKTEVEFASENMIPDQQNNQKNNQQTKSDTQEEDTSKS
jgi:hypothetical protein